ncbi:MAG: hypothetical protein DRN95_04555 [Candidatus Hydrothermarchaeota archaeon]|nr:MAG: hypothetical protein DRN95_04555 [Candidatus Hydrothermarchaeota archaeon]
MPWKVVPKPGVSVLELFDIGATRDNADLVHEVNGVVDLRLDFNRHLAEALRARMPTIRMDVETPRGGRRFARELGRRKRMLYSGSSPFRQIIDEEIRRAESLNRVYGFEELADKVAKETNEKPARIKKLMRRMHAALQIIIKDGKVYPGVKHPDIAVKREYEIIEFKPGQHPVKAAILDYVDMGGVRTYNEIEKRMMGIKWIKRPKTLQRYLKEMVEKDKTLVKLGGEKGVYGKDEEYEVVGGL